MRFQKFEVTNCDIKKQIYYGKNQLKIEKTVASLLKKLSS